MITIRFVNRWHIQVSPRATTRPEIVMSLSIHCMVSNTLPTNTLNEFGRLLISIQYRLACTIYACSDELALSNRGLSHVKVADVLQCLNISGHNEVIVPNYISHQ